MNVFNHFLVSLNVLLMLFIGKVTLIEIMMFSFVFGVLIDLNHLVGRRVGKPENHLRTWVEEPFGFLLIGVPIGILLSSFNRYYLFLTIIPYFFQVLLDYITFHELSPLAPFSEKSILVSGPFLAWPKLEWYSGKEKGISESYFLAFNVLVLLSFVFFRF